MDTWGLTQSLWQSMEGFPSISEGFESDWHLLFVLGYVAWILMTGALYAGSESCCSHRDCYSLAAHSSEAGFESHRVFYWWLLAVHRVVKMRICQHCQQQCDIVKSKVVLSKPGWRLESAYPYQQSYFPPLGWSRHSVLGRQAGSYLHWAAGWSVGTCWGAEFFIDSLYFNTN